MERMEEALLVWSRGQKKGRSGRLVGRRRKL